MKRKSSIGVWVCLVFVCLMLGATVFPDGVLLAADESLHVVDAAGDAVEQGVTSKQVTLLRILSVLAMAVFLVWYIRRKMKL